MPCSGARKGLSAFVAINDEPCGKFLASVAFAIPQTSFNKETQTPTATVARVVEVKLLGFLEIIKLCRRRL